MSIVRKHLGFVRNVALVTFLLAFLVLVWMIRTEQAQAMIVEVKDDALATALIRSGLSPEALCAAGVAPTAAAQVVHDVEEHLAAEPYALASADSTLATARIQEDELGRRVRSGQAAPAQVNAYSTARSALQTAQVSSQGVLDNIFNAGAADLSAAQRTALNAIRSNRAQGWDLPLPYLAVNRSEKEWTVLRDALVSERLSSRGKLDADPAATALLAQVRNDATISAALAGMAANLAAVDAAWQQAVYGQ